MARPGNETRKGTQAGPAGSSTASPAGNDPFGMAEWLKDMPKVPLHPLMQHPAAAMAAATAIGFGMTSQIAGFVLGAMQGLADAAQKTGVVADEKPAAKTVEPVEKLVAAAKAAPAIKAPAKASSKARPVEVKPTAPEPVAGCSGEGCEADTAESRPRCRNAGGRPEADFRHWAEAGAGFEWNGRAALCRCRFVER
ncbi:hypothetical protein LP421_10890 [Rhizobium sp. RCAM05350]|nr:hypothetical protein LP421_10890 [Rhizobium sp. RCAM05350]